MRRLAFILLALAWCASAFAQAFTPRRPFLSATSLVDTNPALPSGVVYYWPCNTNNENNQITGLAPAMTSWSTTNGGYVCKGAWYNGADAAYNAAIPGPFFYTNSWTVCLWCKQDTFALYRVVMGQTHGGPPNDAWYINVNDFTLGLYCNVWDNSNNAYGGYILGTSNITNVWHFYSVSYDHPNTTVYVQIDGTWRTNYIMSTVIKQINEPLYLGASWAGHNTTLYGEIDEVRVWARSLTSNEVWNVWAFDQNVTALTISGQPTSLACLTNTVQSFTVTASGPLISYQWRTNGVAVANTSKWAGATTNVLWITNDSVLYTNLSIDCVVTNLCSSLTSSVAYLTVMNDAVTNGLVGWWKFSEGAGSTVADSTPYNNTGNITNAVWAAGPNGTNCLYFDGAGDLVNIPDADQYSISTNGFSVCGFVKIAQLPAASPGQRMWIFSKASSGANEWAVYINGYNTQYGKVNCSIWKADDTAANEAATSLTPSTNVWYHICATFPTNYIIAAGPFPTLYINSALNTGSSGNGGGSAAYTAGAAPLLVGATYRENLLKGYVYDFRVYNRVITTNEINAIYLWTGPQQ